MTDAPGCINCGERAFMYVTYGPSKDDAEYEGHSFCSVTCMRSLLMSADARDDMSDAVDRAETRGKLVT